MIRFKHFHFIILCALAVAACSCKNNKQAGNDNQNSSEIQSVPSAGGNVSADEFSKALNASPNAQVIDVRTPEEFKEGHLKNAQNININDPGFEQQVNALDKSKPVFVYCLSGARSAKAADYMRSNGFSTVYQMEGGILKWKSAGNDVVTDAGTADNKTAGLSLDDYTKMVNKPNYVMVDFSATWCQPCKKLGPILEKISNDKKDKLTLIKLDADANNGLLSAKGIDGIPYVELYKNGALVWKHMGLTDEATILKETGL